MTDGVRLTTTLGLETGTGPEVGVWEGPTRAGRGSEIDSEYRTVTDVKIEVGLERDLGVLTPTLTGEL